MATRRREVNEYGKERTKTRDREREQREERGELYLYICWIIIYRSGKKGKRKRVHVREYYMYVGVVKL